MATTSSKPILQKSEAVDLGDLENKKKMERGLSHASANQPLVSAARTAVAGDLAQMTAISPSPPLLASSSSPTSSPSPSGTRVSPGTPSGLETPLYTFTLPDLTSYPEDFRGFLEKDLIEMSALISLEQSARLNWWADTGTCQRLWPLATTGDGNCLLHAASLAMWGFHDRLLTLRSALANFLKHGNAVQAIYRRWRWQAAAQNWQSGLGLTEAEWEEEWSSVLRLASAEPRTATHPQTNKRRSRLSTVSVEDESDPLYESLEEVHVLALAHVLRRPIIVIADTVLKDAFGEALAPIPFGGIYLPLEVASSECDHCPLLLTYDSGHFSALVSMQPPPSLPVLPTVVPVTDWEHGLLPLQFAVDPGPDLDWARSEQNPAMLAQLSLQEGEALVLLKEYLDLVQVPLPSCFLDPELVSPGSQDSGSVRDLEVSDRPSKTGRQLQSVAKQFGSIGKTVSKKIKKNLGSITRLARTGSFKRDSGGVSQSGRRASCRIVGGQQDHILAAMITTQKSLPCLQEMVHNYLSEARLRFEKDRGMKVLQAEERKRREGRECVSPTCRGQGSARTSYLCPQCYQHQLQESKGRLQGGEQSKSQFYLAADQAAYQSLTRLPVCRQPGARAPGLSGAPPGASKSEKSLHLGNSTFYQDSSEPSSRHQVTRLGVNADEQPKTDQLDKVGGLRTVGLEGQPCRTSGCAFFGRPDTNQLCSKCFSQPTRLPQASRV